MHDLYPLILALAVAAGLYVLRERYRKRTRIKPARPELTIEQAWQTWRAKGEYRAREDALARARASLSEPDGLETVRREIVHSVTTALYLEVILGLAEIERKALLKGYEEGMESTLWNVVAVSNIRWRVLREYGRLKYDDAGPEDWFEQYVNLAGPYIREKVRLAQAHLVEFDQGALRLVEIYDELLRELENTLVQSPRKKRFPPPDLPAPGLAARQLQ